MPRNDLNSFGPCLVFVYGDAFKREITTTGRKSTQPAVKVAGVAPINTINTSNSSCFLHYTTEKLLTEETDVTSIPVKQ